MADSYTSETHQPESSGGMPQLNPDSFASQLFWLTVVFVALYLMMARSVIPRIRDVLEKRQNHIQSNLDAAETAKNEAQNARLNYESEMAKSKDITASKISETQREIDAMVSDEQAKLSAELQRLSQESEASIAKQREEADTKLADVVKDVTSQIVEHFTSVKPAPAKVEKAISAAKKAA